jgi:5-methylthioadenosine/S-adenosylhomocysteine deaminase
MINSQLASQSNGRSSGVPSDKAAGASLLVRGALVLDPALDPDPRRRDILIRDGVITEIGEIAPEPGIEIVEAAGMLASPGLVNAHMHSQSALMAGFGDSLSHPAFMWLTQAHTSRLTPEEIRLTVLLSAIQMLRTGTSAAIDHFPGQRFGMAEMDAVLGAWRESGLRVMLGMRFFDDEFGDILPEGMDAGAASVLKPQPLGELRALMPEIVSRWHCCENRLTVCPAPSHPDRCTDAALIFSAELAAKHDLAIHTHLLETRRQADMARERFGTTSLGRLEALGVLSDRWSSAHSIWLEDDDIALMARHGMIAVHNPESNARIGAGVMRTPDLLAAGVAVALGTDGVGANDNLAMHEAMRAAALLHRTSEPRARWVSAGDAFSMATAGGARAMRQPIGRLAPGYRADIVLCNLRSPPLTPLNNVISQLVFAETGASVETMIVEGRVVMENRRILAFDEAEVFAALADVPARLRARNADLFTQAERIVAALA